MNANHLRVEAEKAIAKALIEAALAAGYTISVNDGEETTLRQSTDVTAILGAMFTTDEDWLVIHEGSAPKGEDTRKAFGWTRFIYGNDGWDVLSDYTTNLEPIMKPVNDVSDQYEKKING